MSDIPADYRSRLDLAELVARIERQQEEVRKFVAEREKLMAERDKLSAEGRKFDRDRWLAPMLAIVTAVSAVVTASAFVGKLVWGW